MKPAERHDLFWLRIGVAVFAQMPAGIVRAYVTREVAGTFSTRALLFRGVQAHANRIFVVAYLHTSAAISAENREVASLRCFVCHRNAKRKIKWFSDNGRNHFAVGYCEEHGFVKSKVRVRKAADGKFFAIKTTKQVGEAELEKIRNKQLTLRLKRQKKEKG